MRNLRATGATVLEVDPETGRQWRVEAHGGHFGGSLDAVAIGLMEAPKTWHVVEFKTHSAKSFRELVAKGVARAKPQHWAQMQIYMHLTGITRALYVAVCKDTDELHIERVRADGERGRAAARERPAGSSTPSARRRASRRIPTWWECRFCDHHDRLPRRRRRRDHLPVVPACDAGRGRLASARASTRRSIARRSARACPKHLFVPDLVPGEVDRRRRRSCRLPHGRRHDLDQRRPGGGVMLSLRPYQQAAIDGDLRLLRREVGASAGRHPDGRRQVDRAGRLHPGRAAALARPAHPDRHPRARADRAEPRRDDRAVARRAGRHLLGRAAQARDRRAGPVRRHPVDPPPRLRRPAVRSGADRRGAPDPARLRHHVPAVPRHAGADQPAPQGDRLHRDALSARQRHAARGRRARCSPTSPTRSRSAS